MQKTTLQIVKELDTLVGGAEKTIAEARRRIDEIAEQFGFTKPVLPAPGLPSDATPYYGGKSDTFPLSNPADFQS